MEKHQNTQNELGQKLSQSWGIERSINSSDAIEMLSTDSEFIIKISTPIGMTLTSSTKFIGYHSNNLILIETPDISKKEMDSFFQEGFWMNVRAFSQKGEGAIIKFRSQIIRLINDGAPITFISLPGMMTVNQLRKEPRYEVNLNAYANINEQKVEAEIRDISKNGCRFVIGTLNKSFNIGEQITLEVIIPNKKKMLILRGHLCNLQKSQHYAKYGICFDQKGQDNVKSLLSNISFNGTRFVLNHESVINKN